MEKQAQAIAEVVQRVSGVEVRLIAVADGEMPGDAPAPSDAIIFGSPTYNGTIGARLMKFMEHSTRPAWIPQAWSNKIAAGRQVQQLNSSAVSPSGSERQDKCLAGRLTATSQTKALLSLKT